MGYKYYIGTLALLCVLCGARSVQAYDDTTTHPALTAEIVKLYNAMRPGSVLSEEERGWLIEGSKAEDTAPRWINHFFDPVHNEAWTGENEGGASRYAVMFFSKFGLSQKDPLTAVKWANDDIAQGEYGYYGGDNSWKTAVNALAAGDKKAAYVALGHVLHLAEDMVVPDHTRNDTHAAIAGVEGNEGSPLENYAMRFDMAGMQRLRIADKLIASKTPAIGAASIEDHLTELARYSNRYFFSKDTINSPKFENPKIMGESNSYGMGVDEAGTTFPLVGIDYSWGNSGAKSSNSLSLLDKAEYYPILNAYFTRLSRQVVLHGVGIIDLFNRQVEDAKVMREFPTHIVVYDKMWGRTPAFSLFGEAAKMVNALTRIRDNVAAKGRYIVDAITPSRAVDSPAEDSALDPERLKEVPVTPVNEAEDVPEVVAVAQDEPESETIEIPLATSTSTTTREVVVPTTTMRVATSTPATTTVQFVAYGGGGGGSYNPPQQNSSSSDQIIDTWIDARASITEIMYNPPGLDKKEWIEIRNDGTSTLAVTDMKFMAGGANHAILAVSGSASTLASGAFAIIAADATYFRAFWPSYQGPLFTSAATLSNDQDTLALKGGTHVLHEVTYASSSGAYEDWNSLQLTNGVWRAAAATPGSPALGNQPPTIVVTYAPLDIQVGDVVQFDAASSTDSDGAIVAYAWDFGDGASASSTTITTTTHAYASAGNYEVTLVVNDNEGASSTRTFSLAVTAKAARGVQHAMVSEVQVRGGDAGDEFIELFNPTDVPIDISTWSIQYVSGSSEVSTSTMEKKNFGEGNTIPAHGFFLIARGKDASGADGYRGVRTPDFTHRTFSMSGSASGGKVFLVAAQERIESVSDAAIVDAVDYASLLPPEGGSIERRAWVSGACVSALPEQSGEFSGNGCDTDAVSDFEVRAVANPQNATSFVEPRAAPGVPLGPDGTADSVAHYNSDAVAIPFSWQAVNDFQGATSSITYEVREIKGATSSLAFETASTTYAMRVTDIGKTYAFALRARDADGLRSATTTFSVSVPSFFSAVHFSRDTRASSSDQYLIDVAYEKYPFVPVIHGGGTRLVVFSLNDEPLAHEHIDQVNGDAFAPFPHVLSTVYKKSNGYTSPAPGVVFPDLDACPGYGPCSNDLAFSELEDMHMTFPLASTTNSLTLSPSDYLTVSFYDVDPNGGPPGSPQHYLFVARDVVHYPFGEKPTRAAPQLAGPMGALLQWRMSSMIVNWNRATDADSPDEKLEYEVNLSPLEGIDEARWRSMSAQSGLTCGIPYSAPDMCRFTRGVGFDDSFVVGVRARDEFGNYSNVKTAEFRQASTTMQLAQTSANGWSDVFGSMSVHSTGEDSASFQSFMPEKDFSFNTVGVKLWERLQGDAATLRLSVYADNGGRPDFQNVMAQAMLGELAGPDKNQEHVFSFDTPVAVASSTRYWLGLDVAGYSGGGIGYYRSQWANAINVGDVYPGGSAGGGDAQGSSPSCNANCRLSGGYSSGAADWYMRLGLRE